MSRLKVMTIVGTRPEVIRLSRVMAALDRATDHVLVHTGPESRPRAQRDLLRGAGASRNRILPRRRRRHARGDDRAGHHRQPTDCSPQERPDAVLILGDTDSCLVAIAAKRRRIPVFHMEAGNRCFDERVPEEINRRIIDHIADINLPYSSIAREYLLAEGLPADRIIKTGSPLFEVLNHYRPKIDRSDVLNAARV